MLTSKPLAIILNGKPYEINIINNFRADFYCPTLISFLIFKRKKRIDWIYVDIFLCFNEFLMPNNKLKNRFKGIYRNFFTLELPNDYSLIDKQYRNCVKEKNKMLVKYHRYNPLEDSENYNKIVYSIQANNWNPWNYNMDFFEDSKTLRLQLVIHGD